jgi:hypothetical protein
MLNSQPDQLEAQKLYDPSAKPVWAQRKFVAARYGLTRGKVLQMIKYGQVKCINVKSPGAKKGRLLINITSLEAYLNSLPSVQLTEC